LIFYYLTQPISWLIVTLGKQKYLPWIYLVSAVFNVTANYLFIPQYSFYASAIITHLSEFLILILLTIAALRAWRLKYA
jgi:O-antigen/teichoic acid export membrane protein